MKKIPIKVKSYAGHKSDEYPVSLEFNSLNYNIVKILDRWYQLDQTDNRPAANYFKVVTDRQQIFIIKHETRTDNWFLIKEEIPTTRPSFN